MVQNTHVSGRFSGKTFTGHPPDAEAHAQSFPTALSPANTISQAPPPPLCPQHTWARTARYTQRRAARTGRAAASSRPEPTSLLQPYHWCDVAANTAREEEEEEEEAQEEGGTVGQLGISAAGSAEPAQHTQGRNRQSGGTRTAHATGSQTGPVGRCDATATRAHRPLRNTTPAEPTLAPATHSCQHLGPCRWRRGRRGRRGSSARCRRQSALSSSGTGSCHGRRDRRRERGRGRAPGAEAGPLRACGAPIPPPLPGPPPEHCERRRGAEAQQTLHAASPSTPLRPHAGQQRLAEPYSMERTVE